MMLLGRAFATMLSMQAPPLHPAPSSRVGAATDLPVPRRFFCAGAAALSVAHITTSEFSANAATLDEPEFRGMGSTEQQLPQFRKVGNEGLEVMDIKMGSGDMAVEGNSVSLLWVLRKSDGYFVDGSPAHDMDTFVYRVGDLARAIPGFDQGVRGMRQGGRRRFLVPPALAYKATGDGAPGPMPGDFGPRRQIETRKDRETWVFEVELVKVRP